MSNDITSSEWTLVGKVDELIHELETQGSLKELEFGKKKIVLSYHNAQFGALNNKCNHMGGPLSRGKLKNGCIECPWHYWQFEHPRFSTSEELLTSALAKAAKELDVETRLLKLSDLNFRHCEGFYSKSEKACTWPCSITKMDPKDEMAQVYENLVHWADIVIVSTPIRWGNASSLYYKMAERLNSVQNQITLKEHVLIQNKVAGFIITGGQDNVQSVVGQMLNFFGELGFVAPAFPYVGHSLGWSSEDMERNMDYVKQSESLHQQSFELIERSVELSKRLLK